MAEVVLQVKQYIEEWNMIRPGDTVLVGFSGGADSVCLLTILNRLSASMEFKLAALHMHHGMRQEGDRDAAFAARLCATLQIPFYLEKEDVPAYAKEHGMTEEEAGRILRYEKLENKARQLQAKAVAVAHHKNDQAETMLLNLFRGTGLGGLRGMQPVRELRATAQDGAETAATVRLIRPLLCLDREEIEGYLQERDIAYVTDRTNLEDDHTRNRIRHHVLPVAEREVNSASVAHLAEEAEEIALAHTYLQDQAEEILQQRLISADPLQLNVQDFVMVPPILRRYLLMACMERITPHRKDITSNHLKLLEKLCMEEAGTKSMDLPYNIDAIREYGTLTFGKKNTKAPSPKLEKSTKAPSPKLHMETRCFSYGEDQIIPKEKYTKWFDYDRIQGTFTLRTRQVGDRIIIDRQGHSQTLKQYMIDAKIPATERDQVPILADEKGVIWVVGHRISEAYKVQEDTRQILEVQIIFHR